MRSDGPDFLLLLSTQRSGTNYLKSLLQQSDYFGHAGEWYNHHQRSGDSKLSPSAFFKIASSGQTLNSSTPALTLMANQLPDAARDFFSLKAKRSAIDISMQVSFIEAFLSVFRHPVVLRLKRHDKLAQAISAVIHARTGVSHVRRGVELKSADATQIETREQVISNISVMELAEYIHNFDIWERDLDEICVKLRFPVRYINYDDLVCDANGVIDHFCDLVGVEAMGSLSKSEFSKTSDSEETLRVQKAICSQIGIAPILDQDELLSYLRNTSLGQLRKRKTMTERAKFRSLLSNAMRHPWRRFSRP